MVNVLIVLVLLVFSLAGVYNLMERAECHKNGGAYVAALEWDGYACVERNK